MMRILQEHYEQELTNIEKEILEISSKLTPFQDLELYTNSLNNLPTNIEILNRDILRGKEKKFQRDTVAFALGKAYKWNKTDRDQALLTKSPISLTRPCIETSQAHISFGCVLWETSI